MALTLELDGYVYDRWLTAEVERSLDTFAHRFSLRFLRNDQSQYERETSAPQPQIVMGSPCMLRFDDLPVVTGYVDRVQQRLRGDEHELSAEGRSKTGDLVDCSATHKTASWSNKTATEIATDLCEPFGIDVSSVGDTERFSRFACEEGETVFDALDRLCKVRGLLPISTESGNVKLTRIGDSLESTLPMSEAIARTVEQDDSNRYSDYLAHTTDVDNQAQIQDSSVTRYRPLVVVGDVKATGAQMQTRARWEMSIRAGRSERYRCTMLGALDADGATYAPGNLYDVQDIELGVQDVLVCARAVLRMSATELVTELELCRPETYSLREFPKKLLTGTTKTGKAIRHKTRPGQ